MGGWTWERCSAAAEGRAFTPRGPPCLQSMHRGWTKEVTCPHHSAHRLRALAITINVAIVSSCLWQPREAGVTVPVLRPTLVQFVAMMCPNTHDLAQRSLLTPERCIAWLHRHWQTMTRTATAMRILLVTHALLPVHRQTLLALQACG